MNWQSVQILNFWNEWLKKIFRFQLINGADQFNYNQLIIDNPWPGGMRKLSIERPKSPNDYDANELWLVYRKTYYYINIHGSSCPAFLASTLITAQP